MDIQSHYWQFHPQFIKPNTKQANQTNEKVTGKGVQKVHMDQKGSNQLEETESVDMTKLPGKQDSNSVWPAEGEERDIPETNKEEDGDTEVEDDKTNQLEKTESVKLTKLLEKQESNSVWPSEGEERDIPKTNKEKDGDTKVEDDKTNQLEGKTSVQLTKHHSNKAKSERPLSR